MEGAVVFVSVRAVGQAVAHDHVGVAFDERREHIGRRFGGVGVVAVDHEIVIGVDVAHHLAHDVALALASLDAHDGARLAGEFSGAVGGVVVVYIDVGQRQDALEVFDHLRDRDCLVVAGDNDRGAFTFVGILVDFGHRLLLRKMRFEHAQTFIVRHSRRFCVAGMRYSQDIR